MNQAPKPGIIWLALGVLMLGVILGLSLMPEPPQPPGVELSDKALHALAFILLSVYFSALIAPDGAWRVALGLLGFGLLIEFLQAFFPWRSTEFLDVVADAVGIAAGFVLVRIGVARAGRRLMLAVAAR